MSATPRPWKLKVEDLDDMVLRTVIGPNLGGGREVSLVTTGSYSDEVEAANAELIVRAVNSFDDLLAACKEALADMEDYEAHEQLEVFSGKESLAAAIAKAEKP